MEGLEGLEAFVLVLSLPLGQDMGWLAFGSVALARSRSARPTAFRFAELRLAAPQLLGLEGLEGLEAFVLVLRLLLGHDMRRLAFGSVALARSRSARVAPTASQRRVSSDSAWLPEVRRGCVAPLPAAWLGRFGRFGSFFSRGGERPEDRSQESAPKTTRSGETEGGRIRQRPLPQTTAASRLTRLDKLRVTNWGGGGSAVGMNWLGGVAICGIGCRLLGRVEQPSQ